MLRAAAAVAAEREATAIVTGDAIGQVSSQTLQNLAVISRATELPILRPLVGLNKDEILHTARGIGTFDLSKVVGAEARILSLRPVAVSSSITVTRSVGKGTSGVGSASGSKTTRGPLPGGVGLSPSGSLPPPMHAETMKKGTTINAKAAECDGRKDLTQRRKGAETQRRRLTVNDFFNIIQLSIFYIMD